MPIYAFTIVHALGLGGDHGSYRRHGAPALAAFLREHRYFNPDVSADERRKSRADAVHALEWMRRALDTFAVGWLDVVPFGPDLVFLRGRDGAYDFVVRELRDAPPPALPFADSDPRDIPDSVRGEHRLRRHDWFCRGRWRAREDHEAETLYCIGSA